MVAAKAIEHNWSRNVLVMQIETRLPERSGKVITNFADPAQAAGLDSPAIELLIEHELVALLVPARSTIQAALPCGWEQHTAKTIQHRPDLGGPVGVVVSCCEQSECDWLKVALGIPRMPFCAVPDTVFLHLGMGIPLMDAGGQTQAAST